jgi:hypothetical protein
MEMRDDGNATNGINGYVIPDRDTKFSFDPESVTEATHPMWARWRASTNQELLLTLGTLAGNRVSIAAQVRQDKISYGDANGRRIANVSGSCRAATLAAAAATGFSDFSLTFH